MSVVNKMLQDLEGRQHKDPSAVADYQPPQKSRRLIWLVLIVGILMLFGLWLWLSQDKANFIPAAPSNGTEHSLSNIQPPSSQTTTRVAKPMKTSTSQTVPEPELSLLAVAPPSGEKQLPAQALAAQLPSVETLSSSSPSSKESASPNSQPSVKTNKAVDSQLNKMSVESVANLSSQSLPMSAQAQSKKDPESSKEQDGPKSQPAFRINNSDQASKSASVRQSVRNALGRGDKSLAIEHLQQILLSEPEDISVRKKLASLLFAQGLNRQANRVLQQGVDNYPQRSDLRLMLARLYVQQKQNEQAMALLEALEPSADNQKEYWAYRGALAQQLGKNSLAKADYIQLTQSAPNKASSWLGLAIAQDRLGQKTEAFEAYQQAINKDQLSPAVVTFMRQRIAVIGADL